MFMFATGIENSCPRIDGGRTRICFSEQPTGAVAVLTPVLRPSLYSRNKLSLQQLKKRVA